jgi:endonuclease/exonuclease/phosphatase family metal-dependent hydrolase
MKKLVGIFILLVILCGGCRATRLPQQPVGPHFRVLTFNVNWGGARMDLAAQAIRSSGADIVCLQETTPRWEAYLRTSLKTEYPFMEFSHSATRMGGGLAFLAKRPARQIAYIPSETGWFDGWIMEFTTDVGPVQILNVHLRPPISDRGSWVSGYLTTSDDRKFEIERFFAARKQDLPALVVGDFNEGENSPAVRWLESQGLINALPQFDRSTPTWKWRYRGVMLKRRMDHILYTPDLRCSAARVIEEGASDHFPVEAVFGR